MAPIALRKHRDIVCSTPFQNLRNIKFHNDFSPILKKDISPADLLKSDKKENGGKPIEPKQKSIGLSAMHSKQEMDDSFLNSVFLPKVEMVLVTSDTESSSPRRKNVKNPTRTKRSKILPPKSENNNPTSEPVNESGYTRLKRTIIDNNNPSTKTDEENISTKISAKNIQTVESFKRKHKLNSDLTTNSATKKKKSSIQDSISIQEIEVLVHTNNENNSPQNKHLKDHTSPKAEKPNGTNESINKIGYTRPKRNIATIKSPITNTDEQNISTNQDISVKNIHSLKRKQESRPNLISRTAKKKKKTPIRIKFNTKNNEGLENVQNSGSGIDKNSPVIPPPKDNSSSIKSSETGESKRKRMETEHFWLNNNLNANISKGTEKMDQIKSIKKARNSKIKKESIKKNRQSQINKLAIENVVEKLDGKLLEDNKLSKSNSANLISTGEIEIVSIHAPIPNDNSTVNTDMEDKSPTNGIDKMIDIVVDNKCIEMECFGSKPQTDDLYKYNDNLAMSLSITNKKFSSGFVYIKPSGKKEKEFPKNNDMYFYILEGSALVEIKHIKRLMTVGESFYVPQGIFYSIHNVNENGNLKLLFTKSLSQIK